MDSNTDLSITDYQLYLLNSMQPPEDLLTQCLAKLGCTAEEMPVRAKKVSRAVPIVPGYAKNIRSMLSQARLSADEIPKGTMTLYRLPLWPSLNFAVLINEEHDAFIRADFIRPSDSSETPVFQPWRFLEGDINSYFGRVKMLADFGHYVTYGVDDETLQEPLHLRFGWGLLQEIKRLRDFEDLQSDLDDIPAWDQG